MSRLNPRGIALLFLISLLLSCLCTGCLRAPDEIQSDVAEEELYIDARLGFTLLLPLDWEKITIPVSSPAYRIDTVIWEIPAPQPLQMQIRVLNETDRTAPAEALLTTVLRQQGLTAESVPLAHPHGTASTARTNTRHGLQQLTVLLTEKQGYLMTTTGSEQSLDMLADLCARVTESLRDL